MKEEIYAPMEKVLIEGANRLEHNNQLMLLLEYEMEQHMRELEKEVDN